MSTSTLKKKKVSPRQSAKAPMSARRDDYPATRGMFRQTERRLRSAIDGSESRLRSEIADFRKDVSAEIAEFRKDVSAEIAEFRKDVSAEIAGFRTEIAEFRTEIVDLRKDMTVGFHSIDSRFHSLESLIHEMREESRAQAVRNEEMYAENRLVFEQLVNLTEQHKSVEKRVGVLEQDMRAIGRAAPPSRR